MVKISLKIPKWLQNFDLKEPIKNAMFNVWNLVQNDAKRRSPLRTWNLRRSITFKQNSRWNILRIWSKLVYAPMMEYWGKIRAKRWKYLKFKIWSNWIQKKQVRIKERPYLRPALTKNKAKIQKEFIESLEIYTRKQSKNV